MTPARGQLVEFSFAPDAIVLPFQYNPQTISRSRGTEITFNAVPGQASTFTFATPEETPRLMQSAKLAEESLSVELTFSVQDYVDREGFQMGQTMLQPVLDSLRLLVEPRSQAPGAMRMMTDLGLAGARAFDRDLTPSVVLFDWGIEVLPVVLKQVSYTIDEFTAALAPVRATAQVTMVVIEAHNPFIFADRIRQATSAGILRRKPGFTPSSALIQSLMSRS